MSISRRPRFWTGRPIPLLTSRVPVKERSSELRSLTATRVCWHLDLDVRTKTRHPWPSSNGYLKLDFCNKDCCDLKKKIFRFYCTSFYWQRCVLKQNSAWTWTSIGNTKSRSKSWPSSNWYLKLDFFNKDWCDLKKKWFSFNCTSFWWRRCVL